MLESKLADGLASLLLVAGVNGDSSTTWDGRLLGAFSLTLCLRFGAISSIFDTRLGDFLVGEFFYPWVRHFCIFFGLGREVLHVKLEC